MIHSLQLQRDHCPSAVSSCVKYNEGSETRSVNSVTGEAHLLHVLCELGAVVIVARNISEYPFKALLGIAVPDL